MANYACLGDDEYVWYFAYGSNMESKILTTRRRVTALESEAGLLKGWHLSFNFRQFPYIEPSTGTLEEYRCDSSTDHGDPQGSLAEDAGSGNKRNGNIAGVTCACHGVCHKLSRKDMIRIMVTESCNGHLDVDCYTLRKVTVETYSGRSLPAYIFVHIDKNVAFSTSQSWHPASRTLFHGCSKRYLKLLQVGARENGLDPKYVRFLDALPTYTPTQLGQVIVGAYAVIALGMMLFPMLLLYLACGCRKRSFRCSWYFQAMLLTFLRGAWVVEKYCIPPMAAGRNDTSAWETYMAECGGLAVDSGGHYLVCRPAKHN